MDVMHNEPKIHLVKTRLVNTYVVEYRTKIMVIDVAVRCHNHVLGFIEHDLKRSLEDVCLVVCTHDDPDHIGGTEAVVVATGASYMIPYASKSKWRKMLNNPTGFLMRFVSSARELMRGRAWQMYANPERDKQARLLHKKYHQQAGQSSINMDAAVDESLMNEEESESISVRFSRLRTHQYLPNFEDWQVIHTPGHSWDSVCYFHEASGSLITGDTLLGSGRKNRLVTAAIYSDGMALKRSLRKLSHLSVRTVYPGHGSIISGAKLMDDIQVQSWLK